MLFLLFRIGDNGYALAADEVVEIVPLMPLKAVRRAPAGIAGSFDYRGQFVPVVDLSEVELGRPAQPLLSTRIIMTHYRGQGGASQLVGLIAERTTETLRCDPADFAPFVAGPHGLVQRIDLNALLTPELSEFLLAVPVEGS